MNTKQTRKAALDGLKAFVLSSEGIVFKENRRTTVHINKKPAAITRWPTNMPRSIATLHAAIEDADTGDALKDLLTPSDIHTLAKNRFLRYRPITTRLAQKVLKELLKKASALATHIEETARKQLERLDTKENALQHILNDLRQAQNHGALITAFLQLGGSANEAAPDTPFEEAQKTALAWAMDELESLEQQSLKIIETAETECAKAVFLLLEDELPKSTVSYSSASEALYWTPPFPGVRPFGIRAAKHEPKHQQSRANFQVGWPVWENGLHAWARQTVLYACAAIVKQTDF